MFPIASLKNIFVKFNLFHADSPYESNPYRHLDPSYPISDGEPPGRAEGIETGDVNPTGLTVDLSRLPRDGNGRHCERR